MPKTKVTKKVRIYFHHLLMTYSMNRNVVPQPSIDDCVNFFTRSLQYTFSSPVQDRKVDFAADEQIVWLDGYKVTEKLLDDRRTMTTFEITIKSAKYNQVRNVRNTNTMEEKGLLKEIMDGDDESTHFLISHITGRNNLICVQESNYYGIRMGKFTQYLRKRIICSSDGVSIARLKSAHGDRKLYRPLKNSETTPTLFQILLSTVSYNVFSEIVFLAILFMQLFIVESYSIPVMSVVLSVNVFFIVHILCVLWSTIYALYFTYWK